MSGQLATPEMESTASELPRTSKIGPVETDIGSMSCQTSDLMIMENLEKHRMLSSRLVNLLYNIMSGKESVLTCLRVFSVTVINFHYIYYNTVGSRSFEINSGDLQHQTVGLLIRQD